MAVGEEDGIGAGEEGGKLGIEGVGLRIVLLVHVGGLERARGNV